MPPSNGQQAISFRRAQPANVRPLVVAHRGASADRLENTAAAFRRAVAVGADAVELDVQVTRDLVAVVFHDPGLRRLAGRAGRIARMNWSELRQVRLTGGEPIPRLAEVLRLLRRRLVVQIEIKAGVPVAPIVAAVASARAEKWVILASFDRRIVRRAALLAPLVPRMLIATGRRSRRALVRQLAASRAGGISVSHRAVSGAEWIGHFHDRGFAVWTWTVNDAAIARRLAGWGADAILSDNPALLQKWV
jgi:glycerophosphoryl diester phosphodiesterase